MLETYYSEITPCLKIVLTTLHEGEGEGGKNHLLKRREGPINCMSQQFLHTIVG
jgi:hypothetical protein